MLTWSVERVGGAGEEPVSLDEAKRHCRVDHDDDDVDLARMIAAARETAEDRTGLLLRQQTVRITFNAFETAMALPRAPISEVVSVTYADGASTTAALAGGDYRLRRPLGIPTLGPSLTANCWPSLYAGGEVVVEAMGGYAPEDVPEKVRQAILLMIGDAYAFRGSSGDVANVEIKTSMNVDSLLGLARLRWI